jgi:hypothetical protein
VSSLWTLLSTLVSILLFPFHPTNECRARSCQIRARWRWIALSIQRGLTIKLWGRISFNSTRVFSKIWWIRRKCRTISDLSRRHQGLWSSLLSLGRIKRTKKTYTPAQGCQTTIISLNKCLRKGRRAPFKAQMFWKREIHRTSSWEVTRDWVGTKLQGSKEAINLRGCWQGKGHSVGLRAPCLSTG